MDKLEPVIRNRFWILTGLAIPLILYGYFAANGSLKAATEERENHLESVKGGISSGHEPNEHFKQNLALINDHFEKSIDEVIVGLWEKQQERMTWPSIVADSIPEEFLGHIDPNTRTIYKGHYQDILKRLRESVEPVMPLKDAESATWKQKVWLAAALPQARLGQLGITPQEMWDAQIDVWLTQLLLDAVRRTNADKESITDAVLRRIDKLTLFGGTGEPVPTGGTAGAGGGGMDGDSEFEYDAGEYDGGGMGGRDQRGVTSSVAFKPEQEFGVGVEAAAGGGGDSDDGGGFSGRANAPRIRYIKESDGDPFLERGFYMSVIVMQNKIPDFLVELANSPWPVRVTRFHVGENPHRKESPTGRRIGPAARGGYDSETFEDDLLEYEDQSGFGLGGLGGMGDFGGRNGSGMGPLAQNLPEFAQAGMNHPDLVRLELCGVITMYKQPTEIIEKLAAAREAEADAASSEAETPNGEPADPEADPADAEETPEAPPQEPTGDETDSELESEPDADAASETDVDRSA